MRDQLLPLAVSEADYEQWKQSRQAGGARLCRCRRSSPSRASAATTAPTRDAAGKARRCPLQRRHHPDRPAELSGLDRYETITWRHRPERRRAPRTADPGADQAYAPPFLMLGRESREHDLQRLPDHHDRALSRVRRARLGIGAARRRHARVRPAAGSSFTSRCDRARCSWRPYAGIGKSARRLHLDDAVDCSVRADLQPDRPQPRRQSRAAERHSPRRLYRPDRRRGTVGDPGLPDLEGKETVSELVWRVDTPGQPGVPSRGTYSNMRLSYVFDSPDVSRRVPTSGPASADAAVRRGTRFWSLSEKQRVFVVGGLGTSFDGSPLAPNQFTWARRSG